MENNKSREWLYNKFTAKGLNVGSYAQFDKALTDNEDSRKWAYNKAREFGYNVGADYDAFNAKINPTQQPTPQPTNVEQPKPSVDSLNVEQPMAVPEPMKSDTIQPVQPIQSPKVKLVDNPDDYYPTLEQNTRKDVEVLSGDIDVLLNEAKGASARKYAEQTTEAAKGGFWKAIQNAMVNTAGAVELADAQAQTPQKIWGGGIDRDAEKEINDYKAAEHALENARRTINEADINAKNGTLREKMESTFVGGMYRGFGQKLFDARTWDMGVSDFKDQSAINDALDAAENGTLTESQEALLNAKAQEMAVQAYFGSYVGRGYKAGSVTAESLPFMLEMCINPASTLGKSASSRLARWALKKFGTKTAETVGRVVGRALGDVAAASAMTATTGSIRTAADALDRMSGGVAFDTDEAGHAVFDGRYETPEDVGTAFKKAFAATTIENYSEMFGEYFAPMLGIFGKGTRNVLDKITAGRVGQFLDNVAANDFAKAVSAFEKNAQWSGNLGEFAEEIAGGTLNAIIVGDQTFDSNPETGVFNRDNLIDTFLGVALLGGSLSMLKTAGYGVEKYQQKRAVKRADVAAVDAFGSVDEWDKIKTEVDAASNEELPVLLGNILSNPDVTDDQKTALMVYVGAKQREKGAVIGEQKRRENPDVPQEQVEVEQSFDNGAALETPQEKNDAQNMFEYQQQQMRQYFGLGEDGDVDAFLGDDPIAGLQRVAANDQEAGQVVLDYLNAKATVDGVFQRMSDDAEAKIAEADAIIASRTNRNNGMIQRVRLKNDKQAYVLSGDIVMTDDGDMVNVSKSSESLVVIDAITGKKEYTYPSNIAEVYQSVDAETERQILRDQVIDEYSQKLADDMNGTLAFAPGDNYTLVDDQGTQHNVQIVADNGDGTVAVVEVMPDGVQQEAVMAKSTIQEMSDTHNQLRLGQYLQDKKAQEIAIAEQEKQAEQPEVVAEEQQQQPVSALSQVPKDKKGKHDFNRVSPDVAWSAIVEMTGGAVDDALDTAKQMQKQSNDALKAAQKEKPKVGTDVESIIANKNAHKEKISGLQAIADHWANIVALGEQSAQQNEQTEEVVAENVVAEEAAPVAETPIAEEQKSLAPKPKFDFGLSFPIVYKSANDNTDGTALMTDPLSAKAWAKRLASMWMSSTDYAEFMAKANASGVKWKPFDNKVLAQVFSKGGLTREQVEDMFTPDRFKSANSQVAEETDEQSAEIVAEQTEGAPEVAPVAEEVIEPTTEEQAVEQSEISNEPTENNADHKEGKEVVISNQEKETPRIERLLKEGKLAYISKATLPSEPTNSTQGNQSTILGGAILSESKDTTTEPITQEIEQENLQPTPENAAEEQTEVPQQYTITPAQYTNKRGNVLDMHLVKFSDDLSKEQQKAAKQLAKENRGWWDKDKGGFMMRSEESAKELADTILNNAEAVSDAQPVSLEQMREVGSATNDVVETQPATPQSDEPKWKYELTVYENGRTILERSQIMPNGIPISDGHFEVKADSPRDMLGILSNPNNGLESALEQIGTRLNERADVFDFREKARTEGVNGFKIGDNIIYTENGKREKGTIHDFNDYGDHAPVLDLGAAPVLYVQAQWDQVEKDDVTHRQFVQIMDFFGKDLTNADGRVLRIVEVAGAEKMVRFHITETNGKREEFTMPYTSFVEILDSGQWKKPVAEAMTATATETKPKTKQKASVKPKQVNVEGLLGELNRKGEAKLSDHIVEEQTNPSGNKLVTDERYEELKRKMRQKLLGQMNMGIDPEILAIGTEMAVYHIEKGARKFADFAKGMIADLGDVIRPYLKAFYNGARELPEVEREGFADEMTPYEEVRTFDVANFDKAAPNAMATAETTVKEQEVEQQAEVATEKIKNNRNKARKSEKKTVTSQQATEVGLFDSAGVEEFMSPDLMWETRAKEMYSSALKEWRDTNNPFGFDQYLRTVLAKKYNASSYDQANSLRRGVNSFFNNEEINPKNGEKESNIVEAEMVTPTQRAALHTQFADIVKNDMLNALEQGVKPYRSIVDIRKRAESAGIAVDPDGRTDILLQELVEDGLVRAARIIVESGKYGGKKSKTAYDAIVQLYDMQPTIAARSSNRIKMQQYSTPLPMAFVADMFAISPSTRKVLEPTAGNGMMVFAVSREKIYANELDETRIANLRDQGFASVTQQDAMLPFDGEYDAVIANPPFGDAPAKDYDGKSISGLDPQIVLNSLAVMQDNGKAAIIIGGNMEYAPNGSIKNKKSFFTYLYDHYNVKGVIDMSGGLYAKQGTTFPTRMILIDGRRSEEERTQTAVYPPIKDNAIAKVETFEQLYETVVNLLSNKQKTNGTEVLRSQAGRPMLIADNASRETDGNGYNRQSRSNDQTGRRTERRGGAELEASSQDSRRSVLGERGSNDSNSPASRGTDTIGEPANVRGGSEQQAVVDGTQRMVGVDVRRSDLRLTQETKKRELSEEKLPYRPHNTAFSLQSVAPAAMVEAMDNVLSQIEEKYGNIDEFVRKELGYDTIEDAHNALAAEQMDSVAMAIYQMKQGQAMIIGDQTGVGKGRQMAALIRWAVRRGEKPIFITQKADLFSDIYRDLVDIGSGDLVPFIFNSDGAMVDSQGNTVHKPLSSAGMAKVLASGKLPDEYDFAVLTYSQVNTGDDISQKEADELAKKNGTRTKKSKSAKTGKVTPKATFLRAIAADNYLFLDESHTAAGSSNTGVYLQSILRGAKAATFASATFAKRPDTMPLYAIRTAMSQAKVEPDKMIAIIEKGGVTLQEIMSRELTNAGQMVRRERDMSDVVTDWKTITDPKTVERARNNYDRTIAAFNAIIKFQEDYVKPMIESLDAELAIMAESAGVKKGTDKLGVENVPFASKTYNYTKQLMLALKVDAIADEVAAEINAGRHPVIALESTMESSIKDYAVGEVIQEPTFSASLLKGLDSVMQYTVKDEDGNERHAHFSPQQLGAAGEKAYYDLQEFIRDSTSDIFISPLDAIIERLHEKGYKVGELTGRNLYVERKDDGRVVVKRRTDKDKKRMQREFNNGELDVLILNKSASTGISLHASEKFSDQRQRTMIIAQPLSDINDYMQMIGRIDRTGQVHRGYYINLGLPVPAENRFLMMLSTKLKSLNANTTTSQDSESNDVEAPDLLNKYGSQVVIEYLRDNPEVYEKMGAPLKDGKGEVKASDLDEYKPQEDDARKVTGYVALLNTKEQEEFYDDVVKRYTELIKYLNDTGSNDLKITVMPLRAKTIEKRVSSEGIDPNGNNPFARNSYVEQVEMDVLRKPMKAEEIRKTINQINGEQPENHIQNIVETIRKEDEDRVVAEEKRYEKAKAKAVEDIAKQADKINAQKKRTEEEKREAIDIYTDETNEKVEEKHRNNLDRIAKNQEQLLRRLRMFSVSSTYLVPDNLETQLFDFASPAIFCGYKTKEKKITASTTLAVFATLDGRRRIEVKLSQIDALLSISKMTNMNWDRARSTTLENWDSAIPTETRKLGYIMTGNILQAIADTQDEMGGYPGQLISYTDIDGNIHDGILMPDKWNASMLKTSGAPLIARLQQIKEFKPVTSHDGKVEIVGSKWANEYYLTVPKTKKDGAVYFENPTLLKSIYGGNFYPYHGKLRADISADRLEDVVKELTKLGVKVKENTDDNIRFRSSDRAEVIANFDADFAELDSEYQQIDKNDEQAMAEWRAKKKRVVEDYLNYMTDEYALPGSVFVFDHNDADSLDEAAKLMIEVVAEQEGISVNEIDPSEMKECLDYARNEFATSGTVGKMMRGRGVYNIGRAINENTSKYWLHVLLHENTHYLSEQHANAKDFEDIWAEAENNPTEKSQLIKEHYSDKGAAVMGNEVVAYAVGDYAKSKHSQTLMAFIEGDERISLDDVVKNLDKSLPLRNELVIEVLNKLRDEYQRQETEVNTDRGDQEANREREAARQGQESSERSPRRDSQATGQPRRDLNAIATAAEELAGQLHTPIRVIRDVKEITDDNRTTQARKRAAKGWYDINSDEVIVILPNAESEQDVIETVLHEAVAHRGLRNVVGKEAFKTFLDNVFHNANPETRAKIVNIASRNGWEFRLATEEYIASLAERGFNERENRGFWEMVRDFFRDMLSKAKIALGFNINDNDLRYMLWRSYQMQKSKGAMAVAEDVDMQRKLGVGNFRTRQASVEQINAEFNKQLDSLTEENAREVILNVGMPSSLLRDYGVEDKPIRLYGAKLLSKIRKHGYQINDVKNLPLALRSPIAIFKGSEAGSFAILTELRIGDNNVLVTLSVGKGGHDVDFNIISSVYGKRGDSVARWVNNEKLLYVNKEKALDYFSVSAPIAEAQNNQELDSATKIVEDFDNSKYKTANNVPDNIRFREGSDMIADDIDYDAGSMTFEESITNGLIKIAQERKDNAELKMNAIRAIGGNLSKLRKAMTAQRKYDQAMVDSIIRIAKMAMNSGFFTDMSRSEITRLLNLVNAAASSRDITNQARLVVDMLLKHQVKEAKNIFKKLLKVRGSRVDNRGIVMQGKLDVDGQKMLATFKEAIKLDAKDLQEKINQALDEMGSDDNIVAANAAVQYQGLMLAKQYADEIKESEIEETEIKTEIASAKDAKLLSGDDLKEYIESAEDAIRENRLERIEAYNRMIIAMGEGMNYSIARAKKWREEQKERVQQIHHDANSDLQGVPTDEHSQLTWKQKIANNGLLRFAMQPLATFDQMLRFFGSKDVDGRGYLWNRFMSGFTAATDKEWKNKQAAQNELSEKLSKIMGKKMRITDVFSMMRKMPTVSVQFWDSDARDNSKREDKDKKTYELTQGNLLYIYMVNKMSDGRMKLRKMGISEQDVANITKLIDPRFIEFADWLQEDFLVRKRNEYNEVHQRMFGASMAAIENYFPLVINSRSRNVAEKIEEQKDDNARPSTITGSIIKRVRNSVALDLTNADAFAVILDHVDQMERWAAFAEFNRDLNTLLSYKRFRNRVLNMSSARFGAGTTLWKNFKDTCAIAAGVYRPKVGSAIDATVLNLAKGVTASKIALRLWTAVKQVLSVPAFATEANTWEFIKAFNPTNMADSWNWAIEELPTFAKRWQSRQAGDSRLRKTDLDWGFTHTKILETVTRIGMSPNAFIDALACVVGAKAIYETKYKRYLKQGYNEAQAKQKALDNASVAFNETQQSSEDAYLSAMQVDRTVASVALSVFRNSNMAYTRRLMHALSNLKRRLKEGYKEESIAFMAKQMMREGGLTETQANANATKAYNQQGYKDIADVVLFGIGLKLMWELGSNLHYLIMGDDDEEKKQIIEDALVRSIAGPIEGLAGGDIVADAIGWKLSGKGFYGYSFGSLPLMDDIQNTLSKFDSDKVAAINDVLNILVASITGVNLQTLTDAVVAIIDAAEGDLDTSKEIALLLMRLAQVPQSQIDEIYIDELGTNAREARDLNPDALAHRYAEYKRKKAAPITGIFYDKEGKEKADKKYVKRFNKMRKERIENAGDPHARKVIEEYENDELLDTEALSKEINAQRKESESEYFNRYNRFRVTPEYNRYQTYKQKQKEIDKAIKEFDWHRVDQLRTALADELSKSYALQTNEDASK